MSKSRFVVPLVASFILIVASLPAFAQWQVAVGEESNVKVGLLLQGQADWSQDAATDGYAQNLFLRRFRILMGGQILPGLTFFAETDNPNLGKATADGKKGISSGLIVQDAYLEWKTSKELFFDAGLILVPFCRNCLNSAATHMTVDYGSASFLASTATNSVAGRDTGLQARGYLFGDRLEYRAAVTQGYREPGSRNPFRSTGRVQYSFLDPETVSFFYPGTYFGKKKMLNVGAGWDFQKDYRAFAADLFVDLPAGEGMSLSGEIDWLRYDGETTFASIPKQDDLLVQAGLYFAGAKLFPYLRYERQRFDDRAKALNDTDRWQVGLGYFLKGHNANLKVGWGRVDPKTAGAKSTNQVTIQLQGFYF